LLSGPDADFALVSIHCLKAEVVADSNHVAIAALALGGFHHAVGRGVDRCPLRAGQVDASMHPPTAALGIAPGAEATGEAEARMHRHGVGHLAGGDAHEVNPVEPEHQLVETRAEPGVVVGLRADRGRAERAALARVGAPNRLDQPDHVQVGLLEHLLERPKRQRHRLLELVHHFVLAPSVEGDLHLEIC
jgi:hypothetical protein